MAVEQRQPSVRLRVHRAIVDSGAFGLTDREMQHRLHLAPNVQVPRRNELCERGDVKNSGTKRRNGHGRHAIVWVAGQAEEPIRYDLPGVTDTWKQAAISFIKRFTGIKKPPCHCAGTYVCIHCQASELMRGLSDG